MSTITWVIARQKTVYSLPVGFWILHIRCGRSCPARSNVRRLSIPLSKAQEPGNGGEMFSCLQRFCQTWLWQDVIDWILHVLVICLNIDGAQLTFAQTMVSESEWLMWLLLSRLSGALLHDCNICGTFIGAELHVLSVLFKGWDVHYVPICHLAIYPTCWATCHSHSVTLSAISLGPPIYANVQTLWILAGLM
jgi:hypothetical protein